MRTLLLLIALFISFHSMAVADPSSLTTTYEHFKKHADIYLTYAKDFNEMATALGGDCLERDNAIALFNLAFSTNEYLTAIQDLVLVYMLLTSTHDRQVTRPVLMSRLTYTMKQLDHSAKETVHDFSFTKSAGLAAMATKFLGQLRESQTLLKEVKIPE